MIREFTTGALDTLLTRFSGNNAGNTPTLLMLGAFKFSLNTAVFQEVQRADAYRWRALERVGQLDALQYTGPDQSSITLPGVIYPDFRGTGNEVSDLRALAAQGKPQRLLSSAGSNMGMWVIEKVEETSSGFKPDGSARKIEFTVNLRKFSDGTNL